MFECIWSVSYTHLDVYKRQAKRAADTAAAGIRPWISGNLALNRPLSISPDGINVIADIRLTLNNTGHSPAVNVRSESILF